MLWLSGLPSLTDTNVYPKLEPLPAISASISAFQTDAPATPSVVMPWSFSNAISAPCVTVPDAPFAHVYLARGRLHLEAEGPLDAGDAARLTAAGQRRLHAAEPSEVLIWEMHASLRPAA